MILDIRTIIFSYVLTDIVCVLVIALLWLQNRKRFSGMGLLVFDFVFQFLALLLIVLRGGIPDGASVVLVNTFVMTGALMGYMALERFVGKKATQVPNYAIIALTIIVHIYFTFYESNLAARTLNTSAGLLVIYFQCSWLMLYRVPAAMRQLTRWVGIVFGIYCLVSLARIGEYFVGNSVSTDYFQSGTFDALVMVVYQVLFIFLTYALVLMVNKRLTMDITTQEEKYSKAFHSASFAIVLTRLSDGKMIEMNEGFLKMTGYEAADVCGHTSTSLHIWPKEEDRISFLEDLSRDGMVIEKEMQLRKKSGEMFTGLVSAKPITNHDEPCLISSINDITDRKRMESELRNNEIMIRTVLDNLPIGIAVNSVNPEINFTYINDNFTKFYRTTKEAISEPDGFWEAVYDDPEVREKMKNRVSADSASGDPERMIWTNIPIVRKGEKTVYVNARNIQIPGDSLMISTVWDVTDQKRAESQREAALEEVRLLNEALEQKVALRTRELRESQLALLNIVDDLNESTKNLAAANQDLEAVNGELAAFSYSVSHDLRAPLRSIDGFSNALVEDYGNKLNEEGKNYLERIRRATQNMGRLIDDLLNLSRVTQSEIQCDDVDLSLMAEELAEANRLKNPYLHLALHIQKGIIVHADQRLMNIVLTNLLDNAWKFTAKCPDPRIEFGSGIKDGKKVIYIRDNGVGFEMKYAGKLFGAFQRLHRMDEFPGTGVGLATVQRIIHRHGGRIWAESDVGKGATFYFTLAQP